MKIGEKKNWQVSRTPGGVNDAAFVDLPFCEYFLLLISGTALAIAMMVVVWFFARRMNNARIVDIWWSFGFTPAALF